MDFADSADRLLTCGELTYATAPNGATTWTEDATRVGPIWPEIYSYSPSSNHPIFGDRTGGLR